MRNLRMGFLALGFLILLSCNPSIQGRYVLQTDDTSHSSKGSLGGLLEGLIKEFSFDSKYCQINYLNFMKFSGAYEIDGQYVYVNIGGEIGTLRLMIVNENTLIGEGFATGTYIKTEN